jgi:hypothetical protein
MSTFEELDALSSKELHDRAVRRARHHLDVKFFWELLERIPAAEAGSGDIAEAEADIQRASARVVDAFKADDGALADALRPFYIDYLVKHDD